MPQIIDVPNHGQIEFPDGMSDDQIVSAIKGLDNNAANTKALPAQNKPAVAPQKPVEFTPEMTELTFAEKLAQKAASVGGEYQKIRENYPAIKAFEPPIIKAMPNVTKDGFSDETVDMANNVASGATSMNRGIGNLVAGEGTFQPKASPTGNPVDKSSMSYLGGQIIDPTSWALISGMGKLPVVGKALQFQPVTGAGKLAAIGKNAISGAGTGAVLGGLSEDSTMGEGAVAGGIGGAVLPSAISGVNYLAKKGSHLFQNADISSGRYANEVANSSGKRDQIVAALQEKNLPFSGSANAGQATAKVGSPEFAALQEFANVQKPTPASNLASFQEAQRQSTLSGIGRNENELAAAVANRAIKTEPFYDKADKAKIVIDREMNDVFERMPKGVMAKAEEIAKMEGRNLKIGEYMPAKRVTGVDEFGTRFDRVNPEQKQEITGESLHYIKRALSDISNSSPLTGIGIDEQRAARTVLTDFTKAFEKKVPDYGTARSLYANLSKPVNRMETGQLLQKTLKTPLDVGERAGVFAKAVDEAPKTVKTATGFANKLTDIFEPAEVNAVNRVTNELMTNAAQKELAQKGMQATGKILGAQVKPPQIPNPLNSTITYANSFLRALTGKVSDKTLNALAVNMNNPAKLAQLMQQANAAEQDLISKTMLNLSTQSMNNATSR